MTTRSAVLIVSFELVNVLLGLADPRLDACKKLLDPGLSDAGKKPPMRELTDEEATKGRFRRACLQSYGSGFPGGEKAFLKADSQSLRNDLDHLESLFSQQVASGLKSPANAKNDADQERKLHIELGWDREQVLMWGNFFYIRRLFEEAKFKQLLIEVARVRRTFGVVIRPLANWDELEERTYFSKQSLGNLISIMEYRAQSKLDVSNPATIKKIAEDFIANRDALKPYFKTTGDPTREIVQPYCQNAIGN